MTLMISDIVQAIAGKFPNRIAAMMALLGAAAPAIDWAGYYVLPYMSAESI